MIEVSRSSLFVRLNDFLYTSLEKATAFCRVRGHPYVELPHWLHQFIQTDNSDFVRIIKKFNLDIDQIEKDILNSLDELPSGATAISDLSQFIDSAIERAWVIGSLSYGADRIRSGHILIALIGNNNLRRQLYTLSPLFKKINVEQLSEDFTAIVSGSIEDKPNVVGTSETQSAANAQKTALEKYAVNLTEQATQGKIDPVLGRDEEIRQMIDILMRRRQNNPLLAGEAGVGKTAVVEGFALRLAEGNVPPALKDAALYSLDVGLLQAGASMKGEFESRLRQVIDEIQSSEKPIILFIDEIHTLVGAGGQAGTGDAANLLKPALARGQLKTIGATTWSEYKKYIEKDPALTRRFQVVLIKEPEQEKAIIMLRGSAEKLEKHHGVLLLDEAISSAVQLSMRYIPARQLPDKAISLLDTACARVAVSQHDQPSVVEDSQRRLEYLQSEHALAMRENRLGIDRTERIEEINSLIEKEQKQLDELNQRWQKEKQLIEQIKEQRQCLCQEQINEDERAEALEKLQGLQQQLKEHQQQEPLVFSVVDENSVAAIVADWTGIPVGKMVKDEMQSVLSLSEKLGARVIGQQHGLDMIAQRILTSRADMSDPNKPIGVFMLCGPSGVGKTETALALAESLYGGEQNLITINMSEFQEAHTVSTLKGAPPGYVGYGEGGRLTEAVRRRPYSVLLLDEIEKAHPDVHEIFFQVFDKGWMEDGEGRYIDFHNVVIILTSNVGTKELSQMHSLEPEVKENQQEMSKILRPALLKVFPPALLGRITIIPYYPLDNEMLTRIVRLQLNRIVKRLSETHHIDLVISDEAAELIVSRCTEIESGGRMIDAIINNTILPELSRQVVLSMMNEKVISSIQIQVEEAKFVYALDYVAESSQ